MNPPGAPQPGEPPPITPYALRYGVVDYDGLPLLAGSNSSGIAPRVVLPKTRMEYLLEIALEKSQREQLSGFTTQELVDLGAHARENVKPSNLRNPIHPIFDRGTQWISTESPYAMENGWGDWDVGNGYLWRALEPCLLLATKLIESSFLHPWFKALLFGELKPIPGHRFGGGENTGYPNYYVSFHNVVEEIPASALVSKWTELTQHIKFALGIQMRNDAVRATTKNRTSRNSPFLPPTRHVIGERDARIELNILLIMPLLHNITVSERLITQFSIAKTIVHELCHAIGRYRNAEIPRNPINYKGVDSVGERFFYEDEFYVELGYSFENAIFGGVISDFLPTEDYGHIQRRADLPFPPVAAVIGSWPNYKRFFANSSKGAAGEPFATEIKIPLLNPPSFTPRTFSTSLWPIHLSFIEDIQQEEYWENCVPKWGAEMTKIFPRIFSIRNYRDPSNPQSKYPLYRHFGGKLSMEATKAQFPNPNVDAQMRALCIRRFTIVKEVSNTMRLRREQKRAIAGVFGPISFWDPDSDLGDSIPEVDNEEQMRDAIAEALGGTRAELDPQISTEFLIKYFFLAPVVPAEKSIDIGETVLDYNAKSSHRFTAAQFLALPERFPDYLFEDVLKKWGYPPDYPWRYFGDSFRGVRRARMWFREQEEMRVGLNEGSRGAKRVLEEGGEVGGAGPKRAMNPMGNPTRQLAGVSQAPGPMGDFAQQQQQQQDLNRPVLPLRRRAGWRTRDDLDNRMNTEPPG